MSESQTNAISNDLFITSWKERCYQLTFSSQIPMLAGHRNHPSPLTSALTRKDSALICGASQTQATPWHQWSLNIAAMR
jgi:hypothetical protein